MGIPSWHNVCDTWPPQAMMQCTGLGFLETYCSNFGLLNRSHCTSMTHSRNSVREFVLTFQPRADPLLGWLSQVWSILGLHLVNVINSYMYNIQYIAFVRLASYACQPYFRTYSEFHLECAVFWLLISGLVTCNWKNVSSGFSFRCGFSLLYYVIICLRVISI
jgi:hypothetical protein